MKEDGPPKDLRVDSNVRKRVWEGALPVCVRPAETAGKTPPEDACVFTLAPRLWYAPLLAAEVRKRLADADWKLAGGDLAFSSGPTALPIHVPLGVLHDVLAPEQRPWQLTVRVADAAADALETCEALFHALVKQSDYVQHGSARHVLALAPDDRAQLWTGLCAWDFERHWAVAQRLLGAGRSVPCRWYGLASEPGATVYVQTTVPAGEVVGDGLRRALAAAGRPSGSSAAALVAVTAHGTRVPHSTPFAWLLHHLSHGDLFLHLVISEVLTPTTRRTTL